MFNKYPIAAALQARIAPPTAAKKRLALVRLSVVCTFLSQTYSAAMVTCPYGPNDKTGSQHFDNQPMQSISLSWRIGLREQPTRLRCDTFAGAQGCDEPAEDSQSYVCQ